MTARRQIPLEILRLVKEHIADNPQLTRVEVGDWARREWPEHFPDWDTSNRNVFEHLRREGRRAGIEITMGRKGGSPPRAPQPPQVTMIAPKVEKSPEHSGFGAFVWDLETTDLNTFFGMTIVGSFLDLNTERIRTRTIHDFAGEPHEAERGLIGWILDQIAESDVLIGHNTKGFDLNFLQGRLAALGMDRALPKRFHIDTYQLARHGFKGRPQGYSLDNLLDFFQCATQKDKPSKHEWAGTKFLNPTDIRRIAHRCEEDVRGNAQLWYKLRPYYHEWKGR